jgi:hypothetical protein
VPRCGNDNENDAPTAIGMALLRAAAALHGARPYQHPLSPSGCINLWQVLDDVENMASDARLRLKLIAARWRELHPDSPKPGGD